MLFNTDSIVQKVEECYIFPFMHERKKLCVIMSCSPMWYELESLHQIYECADKYNIEVVEIRDCDARHIVHNMQQFGFDGIIRLADFTSTMNQFIDSRIECYQDLNGVCPTNRVMWVEKNSQLRNFPCATLAAYVILSEYFDHKLRSKDISIIGRSNDCGTPLALLLSSNRGNATNATVDIIHSESAHIDQRIRYRDAVVTAVYAPSFFKYKIESNSTLYPIIVDTALDIDITGKPHGDVADNIVDDMHVFVARTNILTPTILCAKLFGGFQCATWD